MKKLNMKERLAVAKQIIISEKKRCKSLSENLSDELEKEKYHEAYLREICFEALIDGVIDGDDNYLLDMLAIGPVDDAFREVMDSYVNGWDNESSENVLLLLGPDGFEHEVVDKAVEKCSFCPGRPYQFMMRALDLIEGDNYLAKIYGWNNSYSIKNRAR